MTAAIKRLGAGSTTRAEGGERSAAMPASMALATPERLVLSGELDVAYEDELESFLARLEATDADRLLIDMSELEFIDCSCIGALVGAYRRSRERGDRLRIIPSRSFGVRRVLMVSGLEAELPLIGE
jgi:anti-anti-sigma factor